MADVLCLGEVLVDWVCTTPGAGLDRAEKFTKAPGGAPANVAVGLARQGVSTAFIGRVSQDAFGAWLKDILKADGIDLSMCVSDPEACTRMAYVVTTETGDRKLAEFSRIACADARLQASDLRADMFQSASFLHLGSISLISDPAAAATRAALELARKNNVLISYDPNVRLPLWPSEEKCRQTILDTLHMASVVKINLDELQFLTGSRNLDAAGELRRKNEIPLIVVTLDADGAHVVTATGDRTVPGFRIELVEATGAGDGFQAGIISGLLPLVKSAGDRRAALSGLGLDAIMNIVTRANAIGALACTRPGAIPALPSRDELAVFLERTGTRADAQSATHLPGKQL